MRKQTIVKGKPLVLERKALQSVLEVLKRRGYETVGPIIRNGAVIYDQLNSVSDLPVGWRDVKGAGTYRLEKSGTETLFSYTVGPHSWKKYLSPPLSRLWQAKKEENAWRVMEEREEAPMRAFFGVRSCEISAIDLHDRVFNATGNADTVYRSRRRKVFIVAVNCTQPGGTCFCASMNTGPSATSGFDIVLTEVAEEEGRHFFVAEAGSRQGAGVLAEVPHLEAGESETGAAKRILDQASRRMGRVLDTSNLKALFYEHFEHPHLDEVAARCLTCGNCTLVCPTCFCYGIGDTNALTGEYAERWRVWDSCFSKDFSYIHGGSIRSSAKSRYRQWLTHKLATWMDQFGAFGCVGCGRCITWCPVGIDITEEAKAILGHTSGSGA